MIVPKQKTPLFDTEEAIDWQHSNWRGFMYRMSKDIFDFDMTLICDRQRDIILHALMEPKKGNK